MSFFETVVAMAYAAFADAPVDVAVVEVGMGGSWDATNVADAQVAAILPIAVDHAQYLGGTPAEIAREKAGILKAGTFAVIAEQRPEVAEVLLRHAAEVGATVAREGMEFGVITRVPAVVARSSPSRACAPATTTCSCRSTAPTRRRTPRSPWPWSRPSPRDAGPAARRRAGARGLRGGDLAGPPRGGPAQPDGGARRRPQPARRRGRGGGAGGPSRSRR